jgi:hypothetical protein
MPSSAEVARIMSQKSARSPRNIETRKKKARRAIPRAKVTRIQGNTAGARKRLKKLAGKARARKPAAATA